MPSDLKNLLTILRDAGVKTIEFFPPHTQAQKVESEDLGPPVQFPIVPPPHTSEPVQAPPVDDPMTYDQILNWSAGNPEESQIPLTGDAPLGDPK